MSHSRTLLSFLLFLPTGCGSEVPALDTADEPPSTPAVMGTKFDPAKAGRVSGRVTWTGPVPNPPGFLHGVARSDSLGFEFRTVANPNRPQIDPGTRAVAGAVVYLRGVNPAVARPWDLPPVRVEMGNGQIVVVQGERRGRAGFVRRGDSITVASAESAYHVLRGRGDAFFSLTLPEPNRLVTRTLATPGRVELSSGTGLYWASADLFVTDHPYFTVTDPNGRFALDRVPAGPVEVVVSLASWEPARQERDPDNTGVARQSYKLPIERVASVTIHPTSSAELTISLP